MTARTNAEPGAGPARSPIAGSAAELAAQDRAARAAEAQAAQGERDRGRALRRAVETGVDAWTAALASACRAFAAELPALELRVLHSEAPGLTKVIVRRRNGDATLCVRTAPSIDEITVTTTGAVGREERRHDFAVDATGRLSVPRVAGDGDPAAVARALLVPWTRQLLDRERRIAAQKGALA